MHPDVYKRTILIWSHNRRAAYTKAAAVFGAKALPQEAIRSLMTSLRSDVLASIEMVSITLTSGLLI